MSSILVFLLIIATASSGVNKAPEEYVQNSSSVKNENISSPYELFSILDRGDSKEIKNIAAPKAKSKFLGKVAVTSNRVNHSKSKSEDQKAKPTRDRIRQESRKLKKFKKGTALLKSVEGTFYVHKVYGDGNCMFRAMSFILWQTENEFKSLRTMVVNHISENWKKYGPFVIAEWNISEPKEYYQYMSSDGKFASELECTVLAKLYNMNLKIYRQDGNSEILKPIFRTHFIRDYPNARLLFSGHTEGGHYDVLLPTFS